MSTPTIPKFGRHARRYGNCTPEGCHDSTCPRCYPMDATNRQAELAEAVSVARAASRKADREFDDATKALDDHETLMGLPSILSPSEASL